MTRENNAVSVLGWWGWGPSLWWQQLHTPAELQGSVVHVNLIANDKGIIWQTWVPLDADAQFVEAQVWYPVEVLAMVEGDRGFRFQLELKEQGVTDEKDTLVSSWDTTNIQVQTLGDRDKAITLAVAGWE